MISLASTARDLFLQTVARLDVGRVIANHLSCSQGVFRAGTLSYATGQFDRIVIIAIGKAAIPMSDKVFEIFSSAHMESLKIEGIVVSNVPAESSKPNLRYFVGGHPLPTHESRRAAETILSTLASCNEASLVLFLISGGASALMEKPLDSIVSDAETLGFHKALVDSGLPITEMNCVRKHFSAVKGGRLALAAPTATQVTLLISDVPEGALDMVGSGPTMPDGSTAEECRRLVSKSPLRDLIPPGIRDRLLDSGLEETPKPGHRAFDRATHLCLLSEADVVREASALAAARGFQVFVDNRCDDWNYEDAADHLLARIRDLSRTFQKVCLLSSGELSVPLPAEVGTGGRNQQFALACALRLHPEDGNLTVLSAGTDGLDGNSSAAGAVVDASTCPDAIRHRLDPLHHKENYDSFPLLNRLGASIIIGPTGNNLRDLRILLSSRANA